MINSRSVLFQKFRLIFIPFFFTAVAYLAMYTFIHWLFLIKFHLIDIKEDYVDYWTPFILPWIAVLAWLRRRIKLLQLKKGSKDATFGIQFAAAIAISIPIIIAQMYLETASGSLTRLEHVDEITKKPESKFYTISSYYMDTANKGMAFTSNVSGKYNDRLNLHIYISCPLYDVDRQPTKIGALASSEQPAPGKDHPGTLFFLDNYKVDSAILSRFPQDSIASVKVLKGVAARAAFGKDGVDGVVQVRTKKAERNFYGQFLTSDLPAPKAWCCFQYSKEISNRKSREGKKEAYHLFYDKTMSAFQNTDMRNLTYLERTGFNDNLTGFKRAIKKTDLVSDSSIRNILEPKFTSYADRNGQKLGWIFGSLAIGSVVWFALLLIYPFDEKKLKNFNSGSVQKNSTDYKEILFLFKPRTGYFVTPLIIDLNILVFLIMVFAGLGFVSVNGRDLIHWGANFRPKIAEGEWWRLLTSTFMHNGIYHLLANMSALLFVGMMLEPKLGTKSMTICYLIAGFCASLASIWWNDAVVSVGASGAIFGLYGIFLSLMLTRVYPKEVSKVFLLTMLVFIGFNLFVGMNGGIDNAAHIGGLLSGIVMGLVISPGLSLKQVEDENAEN